MSTTVSPTSVNAPTQKTSTSSFDDQLNIAKSSQVLVDYLKQQGKSAINADELAQLANNSSGSVPAEVSAAASYMTRHTSVYTAIETHDVQGQDGLSGVWNFEWAADDGLEGTSVEAMANMQDVFDRAIAKSAEITKLTTESKTGLDATKQRPSN